MKKGITMKKRSLIAEEANNKLVNYTKTPKILIKLWIRGHLSSSAYCFYELLRDLSHFSTGGRSSVYDGVVKFTSYQISKILSNTHPTTKKWLKELENIAAISYSEEGYIIINNYEEIVQKTGTTFAKNNNQEKLLNHFFSLPDTKNKLNSKKISRKDEKTTAKTVVTEPYKSKSNFRAIDSYKYSISLYKERIGDVKSEEDYNKLALEHDCDVEDLILMENSILQSKAVDDSKGL